MRYMLDTNVCIYAIKRKYQSVIDAIISHDPSDICISSITYAELLHGVFKSEYVEKNYIALMLLLANIEIVNFDESAAYEYGMIRASFEKKGMSIGAMDTLIAAHAKSLDYTVVTNNTREFERVSGLMIENWV